MSFLKAKIIDKDLCRNILELKSDDGLEKTFCVADENGKKMSVRKVPE